MSGATRPALAATLGAVLLALAAVSGPAHGTASPTVRSTLTFLATDSLTATVRYVRDGGIDVITGVQFALELTHIVVDSSAVIRKGGAPAPMQALRPGDLVTIQYEETERGKVAESIVVHRPLRREAGR